MTGYKSPEEYQAQISMLSHEIYELNKQLDMKNAEIQQGQLPDKFNPFDNPTEYPDYNGDYSDIVPQIEIPGCKIPVEPCKAEKKRIRHFYSIGGACIIFHWAAAAVLSTAALSLIMLILGFMHPDVSPQVISEYAYATSIVTAITAIAYLLCNTIFSFIGLKWAKVSPSSLIQTRDFSFAKCIQYCLAAIFIQYGASIFSTIFTDIISKYGYSADILDDSSLAQNGLGIAVTIIYGCIIAPITEELFFRGMLLKVFSRANQRFAIVATAVFFGLAHGNLAQFMLAFLLGIFLAHIDLKHNSILPSVLVHIFLNTISTAFNYMMDENDMLTTAALNIIYMLMAGAGLIMLIEFSLKNKLPSTTPQQSRRGFAVAKTSIPVICAFGLQVIYLVLLILVNRI